MSPLSFVLSFFLLLLFFDTLLSFLFPDRTPRLKEKLTSSMAAK